jgi:hypothetical protein
MFGLAGTLALRTLDPDFRFLLSLDLSL